VRVPILVLSAVLAVGAASCTRSLDTQELEAQIAEELRASGGPAVTDVSCPEDVEVEEGVTFECTAAGAGVEWRIRATQTDDQGHVQIEIVGQA
jgi:hypothetical protein